MDDEQLERELLRVARGRRTQLQPRVAALRALQAARREARRAKPPPAWPWEADGLDAGQRLAWLQLDLLPVMAQTRGWWVGPADWRRGSSRRMRRLRREADEILAAPDPFAAFAQWRASLASA
jgi:hypothetical protein